MNESGLREGLLGAEPMSAELERRYRERVRALTERPLTAVQKGNHVFGVVLSLWLVVWFVVQLVKRGGHPGPVGIAGLVVGLVFSAGWGLLALTLLRRGTESLRVHAVLRVMLIGGFTLALLGLMLYAGVTSADAAKGNQLILYGLAFWTALGIPYCVVHVARQSELRLREDVLRLELWMARIAEHAGTNGQA
jgi:hypothetical protein